MSEKFGKGNILREMEKKIDFEVSQMEGGKISHVINEYYQKRKKLHKMKILKELYLESWYVLKSIDPWYQKHKAV